MLTAPLTMRSCLTVVLLAASWAAVAPAAVTFTFRRTPNGQWIRQQLHIRTTAESSFAQSGQVISDEKRDVIREQVREIVVIQSDPGKAAQVEITYAQATTRNARRRFSRRQPQPVVHKTYRVTRQDDVLKVTYRDGSVPPLEEVAIVKSDMQAVGRSNPLAQFLDGRTIEIDEPLELPERLASDWLSQSPLFGSAERVVLRLDRVKKVGGQLCGQFQIEMLGPTEDSSAPAKLCQGEVVVVVSTCRTVRMACDARFAISEERGPAGATFTVSNRGTAHLEIESHDEYAGSPWRWASTLRHLSR